MNIKQNTGWKLARLRQAFARKGALGLASAAREPQREDRAMPREALMLELTPLLVRDRLDRVLYWNRAAEVMYGYTREEALGRVSHELRRTEFPEPLERILARLENGRRWQGELVHWRSNGARICVASQWIACLDRRGQLESIIEINHDVTERRRMEEALRETVQELETFAYSISHDMRAPLRAICGFTSLAQQICGREVGPEAKDCLDRVLAATQHMDQLIRDVLAFSRLSRAQLVVRPVCLDTLLETIIAAHPELQAPRAELARELGMPPVLGDEASLTQCLTNLLGNAVKYVAPGVRPRVRLWARSQGDRLRLYIEDNGIGIEPEAQEKIFHLFYRHRPAEYEGTGIGLAIVRRAAERMGGRVGVESAPGQGSRFWLELRPA